jgi:hypothetical protein
MPIYLDPRVIEGSLHSLNDDIKHHCITTLMNGMEVVVLEHRLKDTIEELKNLSVNFNSFKNDLKHSLTQHLHPQQFSGRVCECPHSYFGSGGQYCLSSSGGVECGSTFAAHCNTPFPWSSNPTGSTSFTTHSGSESDIMPPLKEISPGSGSSKEEESDRSKSGGNSGGVGVDSEGSGGETWELFSVSGVRRDSV